MMSNSHILALDSTMTGSIWMYARQQTMDWQEDTNNNRSFGAIGQGRPITKSLSTNSEFNVDTVKQRQNNFAARLPFEAYQQESPYHTVPQPGYNAAPAKRHALQDLFTDRLSQNPTPVFHPAADLCHALHPQLPHDQNAQFSPQLHQVCRVSCTKQN